MSFTKHCVKKGQSSSHGIPVDCHGCNWWRDCYPEVVWRSDAVSALLRMVEKLNEERR